MDLRNDIRALYHRIEQAIHSSRGKDVLLYLLFVCVAFVFWLLLSLDTEVQRDFDVPVLVDNLPDSAKFISLPPATVNAGVTAKGSQLIQYTWGRIPPVRFNFADFSTDGHIWSVNQAKLESRMRDYFGNSVILNSVRPDSIRVEYTTLPGTLVAVHVDTHVTPNIQCIISGPIRANFDSVTVYSTTALSPKFNRVMTEPLIAHDLKDTTHIEVRIKPVPGLRFIPDRIRVTIPVEPLISKRQNVKVTPVNLPEGVSMITFPSEVTLTYLVPMSRYGEEYPAKAVVDYENIRHSTTHLPVKISLVPDYMSNMSVSPDSVEFIIEHRQ